MAAILEQISHANKPNIQYCYQSPVVVTNIDLPVVVTTLWLINYKSRILPGKEAILIMTSMKTRLYIYTSHSGLIYNFRRLPYIMVFMTKSMECIDVDSHARVTLGMPDPNGILLLYAGPYTARAGAGGAVAHLNFGLCTALVL